MRYFFSWRATRLWGSFTVFVFYCHLFTDY